MRPAVSLFHRRTRWGWLRPQPVAKLGALAEPLAVLEAAQQFGRDRAGLLRFQLLAMLGDWYTVALSDVVLGASDREALLADPLFDQELLVSRSGDA